MAPTVTPTAVGNPLTERKPFDWAGAIQRAQAVAGLKDEVVALLLGVSRPRWSQIKAGDVLDWRRLSLLAHDPDGFVMLRALAVEWATFHGLTDLDQVGEWLRNALKDYTRLRMAKAGLRPAQERRKTA